MSITDEKTIRDGSQTAASAMQAGDADEWLATHSDDAVMMPPNQPAVSGKDNIEQWVNAFFSQFNVERFSISVEEVQMDNQIAFLRGNYEMAIKLPNGNTMPDQGKFIHLWKKQENGTWKIARDMWNSSMPLSGGA